MEKQIASSKVLLARFHMNGHTTGFQLQTQELEPAYRAQYVALSGSTAEKVSLELPQLVFV